MDEPKRHAKGMKVRRAVLGDAHVERAREQKTASPRLFKT